jgi:xanthine/uracil permease
MGLAKIGLVIFGIIVAGLGVIVFCGLINSQYDFQTRLYALIWGVVIFLIGIGIIYAALRDPNAPKPGPY